MEQRTKFSNIRLPSFRPGLRGRSNTTNLLVFSQPRTNDDGSNGNIKEGKGLPPSSFQQRNVFLQNHRNASVPILGVTTSSHTTTKLDNSSTSCSSSTVVSDLSFEDAKTIWMLEWQQYKTNDESQYSYSSFDSDLEQSLASIDTSTIPCMLQQQHSQPSSLFISTSSIILENEDEEGEDGETFSTSAPLHPEEDTENKKTFKKQVQFSDITFKEYPMIPGVNPGSSGGIPVTIDWEPFDPVSVDLESYEKIREPNRRQTWEMRMPSRHREKMLRRLGFPTSVLKSSSKEAEMIRKQRHRSNSRHEYMDKANEQLETTIRGLHNIFTLGQKKRKERAYLTQYVPSFDATASNNNSSTSGSRRASAPPSEPRRKSNSVQVSYRDLFRRSSAPPVSTVKE